MIAQAKQSISESALIYKAETRLADLANEIAATRRISKAEDKILEATKIRLWLMALDYKNYLTREQRERIWYGLAELVHIYDYSKPPVLDSMSQPTLVGTSVKLFRRA